LYVDFVWLILFGWFFSKNVAFIVNKLNICFIIGFMTYIVTK
jgi:hypothetical protein